MLTEVVPVTANANPELPAKRSGSQKRVRVLKIPVACDEDEFLLIDDRALTESEDRRCQHRGVCATRGADGTGVGP